MTLAAIGGFLATVLGVWVIVATQRLHGHISDDAVAGAPQKVNPVPTPRIGGLAIFAGFAASAALFGAGETRLQSWLAVLVLASLPAFLGGLLEDLTKRVSSGDRLLLTFVAAGLGYFLLDARITSVGLPGLDVFLEFPAASFLFTLFAVGGYSHAMNIVDGFNGISGVVALMTLAGIAAVAGFVDDSAVLLASLLAASAVAGFLLWNFPRGRVFAGDGGAYFVGFLIAELAILLVRRNSEVSPWFALLALFYPVWETVFSIYRRRVKQGRTADTPDALHLHTLIYRRVIRWEPKSRRPADRRLRNSLTAPYLWGLCALSVGPAVTFWDRTAVLQGVAIAFAVVYVGLYDRIVHFKTPRWLILRSSLGLAGKPRPRDLSIPQALREGTSISNSNQTRG